MTVLLIVGCVLGYLLVGAITSAVMAAVETGRQDDNKAFRSDVIATVPLWPLVVVVGSIFLSVKPFLWAWRRSVLKLNPSFKGFK